MYVQRLAEEGLHERLEQLFLELLGPSYPFPSRSFENRENIRLMRTLGKGGHWESTIAGLDKRKLLREVLEVTGRFRELQAMNVQYDAALKDLEEHDEMIID
jgi:hypothetical protein